MLSHGICTYQDPGFGFRCPGRYPINSFLEDSWTLSPQPSPRLWAKRSSTSGSEPSRSRATATHTGSRSDPPLTSGPCLLRDAPGGLVDWCQQQELRGITSMRPIWQAVLDQELTTLALLREHLRRCGVVQRGFKQFRVDATMRIPGWCQMALFLPV